MNRMTVDFIKGSDVTILLNGEVLGGVSSAEISDAGRTFGIGEYLSSIPVAQIKEPRYIIRLKLESSSSLLPEVEAGTLSFLCRGKTEVFTRCCVTGHTSEIPSNGRALHTVTIESSQRSVEYE